MDPADVKVQIPGLRFPSEFELARQRAEDFQSLSPEQRMAALDDVLQTGLYLLRDAPNRKLLDQVFLKREEEWQRIQKELFRKVLPR